MQIIFCPIKLPTKLLCWNMAHTNFLFLFCVFGVIQAIPWQNFDFSISIKKDLNNEFGDVCEFEIISTATKGFQYIKIQPENEEFPFVSIYSFHGRDSSNKTFQIYKQFFNIPPISIFDEKPISWRYDVVHHSYRLYCPIIRAIMRNNTFKVIVGVNYYSQNISENFSESENKTIRYGEVFNHSKKNLNLIYYFPMVAVVFIFLIYIFLIAIWFFLRNVQPLKSRGYLPLVTLLISIFQLIAGCLNFASVRFVIRKSVYLSLYSFDSFINLIHIFNLMTFILLSYLTDERINFINPSTKKIKWQYRILKFILDPKFVFVLTFIFIIIELIRIGFIFFPFDLFQQNIIHLINEGTIDESTKFFAILFNYFFYFINASSLIAYELGRYFHIVAAMIFITIVLGCDFSMIALNYTRLKRKNKIGDQTFAQYWKMKTVKHDVYMFRYQYTMLFIVVGITPFTFFNLIGYLEYSIAIAELLLKFLSIFFQVVILYILTFINLKCVKKEPQMDALLLVLEDPMLREEFKTFTKNEFSLENLLCYDDILLYEKLTSEDERKSKAEEIKTLYLTGESLREVNIRNAASLVKKIEEGNISDELFSPTKNELMANMVDTYSRFILDSVVENLQEKQILLKNFVNLPKV
jgi:hypothetical protein